MGAVCHQTDELRTTVPSQTLIELAAMLRTSNTKIPRTSGRVVSGWIASDRGRA